jgi:hypothetical protein
LAFAAAFFAFFAFAGAGAGGTAGVGGAGAWPFSMARMSAPAVSGAGGLAFAAAFFAFFAFAGAGAGGTAGVGGAGAWPFSMARMSAPAVSGAGWGRRTQRAFRGRGFRERCDVASIEERHQVAAVPGHGLAAALVERLLRRRHEGVDHQVAFASEGLGHRRRRRISSPGFSRRARGVLFFPRTFRSRSS